jgi:4-hydroxy-tetrahydrodipicolinate synthase
MMIDPAIKAAGVISVLSNLAPKAVTQMVNMLHHGDIDGGRTLHKALTPLFDLVTVKTMEATPYGEVSCRARNPLAIKTLMAVLGMPAGPCRRPLGKMTRKGFDFVLQTARKVWRENPEILKPAADFFGVKIAERLDNPKFHENLFYSAY